LDRGDLCTALRTIPISLRNIGKRRSEAEHVIPVVACVAEEHLFVILSVAA
jgi:hypothetical protein